MGRAAVLAAAIALSCSRLSAQAAGGDPAALMREQGVAILGIEQAVEVALRNSDELRYARFERDIAGERVRLSLRSFLPALTLGYAQNDSVVYAAPDSRLKRLSVGLSQPVFDRGARLSQHRLGRMELGIQSQALDRARAALVVQVTNLYLEALKARLEHRILEDSSRNTQTQIRIAAEELRLGEITELDYLELVLAGKDQELELARRRQEEERRAFELAEALDMPGRVQPAGTIAEDYGGLLEERDPSFFVAACLGQNLELRRREVELQNLRAQLVQSRVSWLPGITARAEFTMSGEEFPLTEPGFSVGLDLDFAPPLLPTSTASTAGFAGGQERSAGISASVELGGNVEGVLAIRLARLRLDQACARLEGARRSLEFAIRHQLQSREHQLEALALLREKQAMQERTQGIRSLMADLGEITRLELVEGEADLAGLRIEILSATVALFNQEVSLLEQCGLPGLETSFRAIIAAEPRAEGAAP